MFYSSHPLIQSPTEQTPDSTDLSVSPRDDWSTGADGLDRGTGMRRGTGKSETEIGITVDKCRGCVWQKCILSLFSSVVWFLRS
jgi:hypothetical protein